MTLLLGALMKKGPTFCSPMWYLPLSSQNANLSKTIKDVSGKCGWLSRHKEMWCSPGSMARKQTLTHSGYPVVCWKYDAKLVPWLFQTGHKWEASNIVRCQCFKTEICRPSQHHVCSCHSDSLGNKLTDSMSANLTFRAPWHRSSEGYWRRPSFRSDFLSNICTWLLCPTTLFCLYSSVCLSTSLSMIWSKEFKASRLVLVLILCFCF